MSDFSALGLSSEIISALDTLNYKTPTEVQRQAIPSLLQGRDLIVQAQTGTGKTAAFALPLLMNINLEVKRPQALVITPTRELAMQVADFFKVYAKQIEELQVLPVYGGQGYSEQLRALKYGAHVIVGTPGRIMDHLRRGTLDFSSLQMVVLDEADEMLKMGFVDDVKWILNEVPAKRQTALFSATMPAPIEKISKKYLNNPYKIEIKSKTKTVSTITQFYTIVNDDNKTNAAVRFLEAEKFEAAIVFAQTKEATTKIAQALEEQGHAVTALNGDLKQKDREKVIRELRTNKIRIVIATDVAARGLDVEQIDLVVNYDLPYDPETYIHRIGRTGRAGRSGKSISFANSREERLIRIIEKVTNQKIEEVTAPSMETINKIRKSLLNADIKAALASNSHSGFKAMIKEFMQDERCTEIDIAAALAYLMQKRKLELFDLPKVVFESGRKNTRRRGDRRKSNESRFSRFASEKDSGPRRSSRKKSGSDSFTSESSNKNKSDKKKFGKKKYNSESKVGKSFSGRRSSKGKASASLPY